jgi:glycosyltransferase involved in cell wall biosynthesis
MDPAPQQNSVTREGHAEPASLRKSVRPVLLVSPRNLVEQTTFIRHLLVGLTDESIPAAMICPPGFDVESDAPSPAAVFTHPLIDLPLMNHIGIADLASQLEKFKPTVLHCLSEERAGLTRRLSRRLRLPALLMIGRLGTNLQRLAISPQWCSRLIVPAEAVGADVRRTVPHFADRVQQINVGAFVDPGAICFSDAGRLPSIVVAHPLDRVSDFEPLLRALGSLQAEGREFAAAIMGSGPAERLLRGRLAALGLSQAVTIVPILHPWRSVLAAADIFVQPQPLRACSVFLLEAMAVGTAVAACWGGVDDLVIPDQTAATFESDNETSIRDTLTRLLDDRDTARRLAATAQEHLRARHTVSEMIETTLRTYAEVQAQYRR